MLGFIEKKRLIPHIDSLFVLADIHAAQIGLKIGDGDG